MTTITAEQATDILGAKPWSNPRNDSTRYYLNDWMDLIGLKATYYKTGNISNVMLRGEQMSNADGYRMGAGQDAFGRGVVGKAWIENGQVHTRDLNGHAARLVAEAIADKLTPAPATVTTAEAAAQLGVSIRTIQRRAQRGQIAAAKDTRGRWIITL